MRFVGEKPKEELLESVETFGIKNKSERVKKLSLNGSGVDISESLNPEMQYKKYDRV